MQFGKDTGPYAVILVALENAGVQLIYSSAMFLMWPGARGTWLGRRRCRWRCCATDADLGRSGYREVQVEMEVEVASI